MKITEAAKSVNTPRERIVEYMDARQYEVFTAGELSGLFPDISVRIRERMPSTHKRHFGSKVYYGSPAALDKLKVAVGKVGVKCA